MRKGYIFGTPKKIKCPGGEIGRRTTLRGWRPKGCSGSNPLLGTKFKIKFPVVIRHTPA